MGRQLKTGPVCASGSGSGSGIGSGTGVSVIYTKNSYEPHIPFCNLLCQATTPHLPYRRLVIRWGSTEKALENRHQSTERCQVHYNWEFCKSLGTKMLFSPLSPARLLPTASRRKEDSSLETNPPKRDLKSGGPYLIPGQEAHRKTSLEHVHGTPMNRQPRITRAMREVPHKKSSPNTQEKNN